MFHHLRIQGAQHGRLKPEIAHEEGPRGYVYYGAGEGFVEGGVSVPEAGDTGAGAEGGGEGAAEGDEGVFGCVVVVNWGGGEALDLRYEWKNS